MEGDQEVGSLASPSPLPSRTASNTPKECLRASESVRNSEEVSSTCERDGTKKSLCTGNGVGGNSGK
eukprot:6214146-Pleurochrysis_carterae.AAC.1